MKNFNKKTLFCQIQDASIITSVLSAFGASTSTFLTDVDTTPLIVSGATMTASIIGAIASGYIEHKKTKKEEEKQFQEPFQIYRIMSEEEFEARERMNFHEIEPAYSKEDNILSIDFEKISDLRRGKSLTYKKKSR